MPSVKDALKLKDFWEPLLANIPAYAVILDRDCRILYVNHISPGLSPEEVIGASALDFIAEEDRATYRRRVDEAFRGKSHGRFEVRGGSPGSGFPMVYEEQLFPIRDASEVVAVACIANDITVRRAAEERARTSEEHFRQTFDASPDGMVFVDPNLRILKANEAYCRLLGYSRSEVEGRLTVRDITAPEYRDMDESRARRLLAEGGNVVFEKEYIRKDGSRVPVELSVWAVRGADGKPSGFHTFIRDLTQRRTVERELSRTVSLLRSTLDSTADGILVVDLQGRIVSFNERFARMWRIPRHVLSRNSDEDALRIALEQVVDPLAFHDRVQELYSRPLSESLDTIEFKDGRVFERASRPHLLDGEPIGRVWCFRDITERRRAEQELERSEETLAAMFESCPDGIAFASTDGTFLKLNAAFLQLTGYSREELIGKKRFLDITPVEHHAASVASLGRLLDGVGLSEFEKEYVKKDGSRVPVWLSCYLVRGADGKPVGANAFVRDISDAKRAQEARRRHAAILELMQSVSAAANLAATSAEAIQACIDEVCAFAGWPIGHAYLIPEDGRGLAEPTSIWYFREPARYETFRIATEKSGLPIGEGLPGRVWEAGRPLWLPDFPADASAARARAAKTCGLGPAVAFPVLVKERVAAVLEFFMDRPAIPDAELLQVMAALGTQLGRAIERERAERALRQREELLRLLVAGVQDYAIFMLDTGGRIVSWNEGAERIFGMSEDAAIGLELGALYPAKDRAEAESFLRAAMEDGRSESEGWRVRKDGARFWANVVLTALRDEGGALRGFASVTRDITERKRMEREVLEAGSREQRRIAQDLHDSLGQQLTGIALLSQVLHRRLHSRKAKESADARKIAAHAADAVRQARELAQGLLPAELGGGLADALRALGHYAREALQVECDIRCDRGAAAPDELATAHLYRIAQEAVNNAVRHGRARRIDIRLSAEDHRLVLSIEDDGIGVPPARRRRTGLGLGIMQYRARMMGASLEIRRAKGPGTIVVCSCPLP